MTKRPKLKNTINSQFQTLRRHLLSSYLVVMLGIILISDVLVYKFFTHSLYKQLDQRLLNLAQAASHSLVAIKKDNSAIQENSDRPLDNDQDLDIPWEDLKLPKQSVQWFDFDGQLLATSGTIAVNMPVQEGFQTWQSGQIRSLTIPAYRNSPGEKFLEGYIRVSESIDTVEVILSQLRWGFILGGFLALAMISLGGRWLTRQSLQPIEQSFQQLRQFTADASHELRSPLTVIKTSTEVIFSHPERIHAGDVEKFKAIISATNQMTRLVEDLLFLARTDAIGTNAVTQRVRYANAPSQEWIAIPLEDLLEDVVEFLEPQAEVKNITLNYQKSTQLTIMGDPSWLIRLFSNLLENALQYTPVGGEVKLSLENINQFLMVTIEDSGIGIAPEDLPFIFQRLWRSDQARSCRSKGSGLGLAIAQAIAITHGGEITVKSQLGLGTSFYVFLPTRIDP